MLDLNRAAFTAHVRQQRLENLRVSVSLIVAGASLLAAFASVTAPAITVIGALWAIAYAIMVSPLSRGEARRSAIIQEMFDTVLFGLWWNTTLVGNRLRPDEISHLAQRFSPRRGRGKRLRDWYVDTTGVPQPYDILICQQQNLAWDARLRRRWATVLLCAVIVWVLAGVVVGFVADLTVPETLLRWYVPSLAALVYGLDGYRLQRDIAAERERVMNLVQAEIEIAQPAISPSEHESILRKAREIQDVIFANRKQAARVPDWFYAALRDKDENDFAASAAHLRRQLSPDPE